MADVQTTPPRRISKHLRSDGARGAGAGHSCFYLLSNHNSAAVTSYFHSRCNNRHPTVCCYTLSYASRPRSRYQLGSVGAPPWAGAARAPGYVMGAYVLIQSSLLHETVDVA